MLDIKQNDAEMSLSDHIEELRQRLFWVLSSFIVSVVFSSLSVKTIVKILQEPAFGIKFLQFAPGEYFFVSLKIILYTGLLLSSPFFIYQAVVFVLPGMTQGERKNILPIVLGALILFLSGILFGYSVLVPAALNFFISYGTDVVEPFWSFEQYFEFVLILLFSTGFAFQLPILQVILGLLRIISGTQMVAIWRYIVLLSTVVGAILTPSVDPLTQILMSFVIIFLYFLGVGIVFLIEKSWGNIVYDSKF
jgi:sec-independent protein translocase protein TatC